jgi:CheY-like chemotaxis protein
VIANFETEIDKESTRILFVDDEPLVLEGLRRSVYREFVADLDVGPEEGLAKLRSSGPYAVVVSDMRMPAMDGAEFLATCMPFLPIRSG